MSVRKPLKIQVKKPTARIFSAAAGWRIIDGRKIYFRSRWEYVYAVYLQWQKDEKIITDWQYEPETFWFENIKRGVRSYKPDFAVYLPSAERYWVEVKGFMDARSKTKLARFKRYYPQEKLIVIGKEWFERRSIRGKI